jgi:hypothetical protein
MTKILTDLIYIFLLANILSAQTFNPRLDPLIEKFKEFEYKAVIDKAQLLIDSPQDLNETDLCEIYRLKGISHYSLLDMERTLECFVSLLEIDPDYQMDPKHNSPKVIVFFKEIKNSLHKESEPKATHNDRYSDSYFKEYLAYSLVLPGLGHVKTGQTTKGWILMSASILTIGSGIYFSIEANQREKDYLNETEKSEIESVYNRYNETYKLRNAAFIGFAAIWLYAQTDLLFFSKNTFAKDLEISFYPAFGTNKFYCVSLRYSF